MNSNGIKGDKGFISRGIQNFTPGEAHKECLKGGIIVDLRRDYLRAYKQFGVDNVYYTDYNKVFGIVRNFPTDKVIILAETSGNGKAVEIVGKLNTEGFKNVYNLAGGFVEWERDGLPVRENIYERLSGSCMCQLKPRQKRKSEDKN